MSATRISFNEFCRQAKPARPSDGCVYLLQSRTYFKIGSTHRPNVRIPEQAQIGRKNEKVILVLLSCRTREFREVESKMKRLMFGWTARGWFYNPKELYRISTGLMPFVAALIESDFSEEAWSALEAACRGPKKGVAVTPMPARLRAA